MSGPSNKKFHEVQEPSNRQYCRLYEQPSTELPFSHLLQHEPRATVQDEPICTGKCTKNNMFTMKHFLSEFHKQGYTLI